MRSVPKLLSCTAITAVTSIVATTAATPKLVLGETPFLWRPTLASITTITLLVVLILLVVSILALILLAELLQVAISTVVPAADQSLLERLFAKCWFPRPCFLLVVS